VLVVVDEVDEVDEVDKVDKVVGPSVVGGAVVAGGVVVALGSASVIEESAQAVAPMARTSRQAVMRMILGGSGSDCMGGCQLAADGSDHVQSSVTAS
jgi:hypothetical protein